ncbi:MAG TPA: sulfur carrier protein ThiS [Acidimicrobiales bacterium]|nr:sulfur carrier protein ThiS [Acidimicrobiales bacterium]
MTDRSVLSIVVNGAPQRVAAGTTLATLVGDLASDSRGVAVAVDRVVVPRSTWDDVVVSDGAHVEVVTAAAGG